MSNESESHKLTVRNLTEADYDDISLIMDSVYRGMGESWKPKEFKTLLKLFPEGQICIEDKGRVVAAALALIEAINQASRYGFNDWRLPTIVELESLTDMDRHSPALSFGHPFANVRDFYWSSTTSQYDNQYAWVLYLQDGAVGVGHKPFSGFYLWPVRGKKKAIPAIGAKIALMLQR